MSMNLYVYYIHCKLLIIIRKIVDRVENIGVEPMTPCVQGRCSSQLS